MSDAHRYYLRDIAFTIKERALDAKKDYQNSSENGKAFAEGYLAAYHHIINMMKNQAVSFNLDEKDICLDNFDPYKELME